MSLIQIKPGCRQVGFILEGEEQLAIQVRQQIVIAETMPALIAQRSQQCEPQAQLSIYVTAHVRIE